MQKAGIILCCRPQGYAESNVPEPRIHAATNHCDKLVGLEIVDSIGIAESIGRYEPLPLEIFERHGRKVMDAHEAFSHALGDTMADIGRLARRR